MTPCVVAVRDSAVGAYMAPMSVVSIPVAVRSFKDQCNATDSPLFKHPEDFELWHLANFDEVSGAFLPCEVRCVARAKDLKGA